MTQHIQFPSPLESLLRGSAWEAPIRQLADRVGQIVADNKLTFFPDYTDHGVAHINDVLKSEVELVPAEIWEARRTNSDEGVLTAADAAVIIGATLLHDFAMHLYPPGFLQLVAPDSRFRPLGWFKEDQEGHGADRPWHKLWDDYQREARRFSDRQLTNILGPDGAKEWKYQALPKNVGEWTLNDRLIIGEFLRRHHARLAHEIAIYGFPGLEPGSGEHQFPAMGTEKKHQLRQLADLIGVTARSHGMSLRVVTSYLETKHDFRNNFRPKGCAVLYPMALLRIADYLQLDRNRAPAVLLQLHDPQSPISVREWANHDAVIRVARATDSTAVHVEVGEEIQFKQFLHLEDLLAGLQREMDHSTAVLSERYGHDPKSDLAKLVLAMRRVISNIELAPFRNDLKFLPKRTGFSADPQLLTLLVEPLYGKHPSVGVRELMQNAVDAVRELEEWCKSRHRKREDLDLPEIKDDSDSYADVSLEFMRRENDSWFLRVIDRGIGMTGDTVANYFLRAGASFRRSSEWAKEFSDEQGKSSVVRIGQFGIGAFAVFLLGPSFRLWTRHAEAREDDGYSLQASQDDTLIEIRRERNCRVGTHLEVELSAESLEYFDLDRNTKKSHPLKLRNATAWYCWDWPRILFRVSDGDSSICWPQILSCPIRGWAANPEMNRILYGTDVEVFWTFAPNRTARLSCNGMRVAAPIRQPHSLKDCDRIGWPMTLALRAPFIAVSERAPVTPLTTQRYELRAKLPFLDTIVEDTMRSFLAFSLVCGPQSPAEALNRSRFHPGQYDPLYAWHDNHDHGDPMQNGFLRWCATDSAFIPADALLFPFLKARYCVLFGAYWADAGAAARHRHLSPRRGRNTARSGIAMMSCHAKMPHDTNREGMRGYSSRCDAAIKIDRLRRDGFTLLGRSHLHELVVSVPAKESRQFSRESWDGWRIPEEFQSWIRIPRLRRSRAWFQPPGGSEASGELLQYADDWERGFGVGTRIRRDQDEVPLDENTQSILFVAKLEPKPAQEAESVLARVWHKCLGNTAIPFETAARQDLIARASEHADIKPHIESWEQMKANGHLWTICDYSDSYD